MSPVGFEPTFSAGERLHTCVIELAATGTGGRYIYLFGMVIGQLKVK